MNPWDYEGHLQKCREYIYRAHLEEDRDDFYKMWLSLVQEHLLRAAINAINPMLGADTKNEKSVMALAGHGDVKEYRTADINLVHQRLISINKISPEFLDIFNILRTCRNADVHSAISDFHALPKDWLAQFYRACSNVLVSMGLDLESIFDKEEVKAAKEMMEGLENTTRSYVEKLVNQHKEAFQLFTKTEQEMRLKSAEDYATNNIRSYKSGLITISHTYMKPTYDRKLVNCPACTALVILYGQIISEGMTVFGVNDLQTHVIVLPNIMGCTSCGLKLVKNSELTVVGLGNQFTGQRPENYGELTYEPDEDRYEDY